MSLARLQPRFGKTRYGKNSSIKAWPKRLERGKSGLLAGQTLISPDAGKLPGCRNALRRPLTMLFEPLEKYRKRAFCMKT